MSTEKNQAHATPDGLQPLAEAIVAVRWLSASHLIEELTKEMAREFKTSRPRPRNRAMGFNSNDKPLRNRQQ